MKFDKFMEHCYKMLCFVTALIIFGSAVFSCARPLLASADELDWLQFVFEYEDEFRQGLIVATRAENEALNDTNLSDEEKTAIRSCLALQEIALRSMPDIYGNPIDPILPDSDTVTFSGSTSSGVYRSALDREIHSVVLLPGLPPGEYRDFTATCAASDEFNYTITYTQDSRWDRNVIVTESSAEDGWSRTWWNNVWMWGEISVVADNYWHGHTVTVDDNYSGMDPCYLYDSSLPDDWVLDRSMNYNPLRTPKVMGYGNIELSLPSASVDTQEPWEYYNDTLLPYMQENYPEVTNNYYVFPNGYTPAPNPTDPTEPTAPSGDLVLPPYGELVTEPSSYYVTDESGETITDESGEPVTETTMVPVTAVTVENGNYFFRVPTLPSIYMTDTGELNISLPIKYASICGGLFSACYDVLDSSGILSVLPFLVGMAVLVYVIYKVGG